jgi:hypothetical protein
MERERESDNRFGEREDGWGVELPVNHCRVFVCALAAAWLTRMPKDLTSQES